MARNIGANTGSWLVLPHVLPFPANLPPTVFYPPSWPSGLVARALFPLLHMTEVDEPGRYSLDRVTLAPGADLGSIDLGGATPPRTVMLRGEAGVAQLVGAAWNIGAGGFSETRNVDEAATPGTAPILRAGDSVELDAGEDIAAAGVRALGRGPAVLLVLRIGQAPGS